MKRNLLLCLLLITSIPALFSQDGVCVFTPTNISGGIIANVQINGGAASVSDYISAYDPNGICAGNVLLFDYGGLTYCSLQVYGDDTTTPDTDEGMNEGETITFKLWVAASGEVLEHPMDLEPVAGWNTTLTGQPVPGWDFADGMVINFRRDTEPTCDDPCAPNFGEVGECDAYSDACNEDCSAGPFGGTWDVATCACVDETTPVNGCTDATANNFNPDANCDDSSCTFACPDPGTCDDGDCANGIETWDADNCECVAGTAPVDPGCDDGDCTNGVETWDGCECVAGTAPTPCEDDGDCSNGFETWNATTCECDTEAPVLGCTNDTATNFDPAATCDDDSCDFACPDPGTCDDGDCANGVEAWDGDTCECVAGTPPVDPGCDDGDCSNGVEAWDGCECVAGTPPTCGEGEVFNAETCACEPLSTGTCDNPPSAGQFNCDEE